MKINFVCQVNIPYPESYHIYYFSLCSKEKVCESFSLFLENFDSIHLSAFNFQNITHTNVCGPKWKYRKTGLQVFVSKQHLKKNKKFFKLNFLPHSQHSIIALISGDFFNNPHFVTFPICPTGGVSSKSYFE